MPQFQALEFEPGTNFSLMVFYISLDSHLIFFDEDVSG